MALEAFQFKQFSVAHDRCAMKVGTDAVLLGAWATVDHRPNAILDIGAGSGILALMLAQRSAAELIDALEIDASAYEQCVGRIDPRGLRWLHGVCSRGWTWHREMFGARPSRA